MSYKYRRIYLGGTSLSEQTIQNTLYSTPVSILDKYTCYSLGATTVRDLVAQNMLEGVLSTINLGKRPDVLIVDKDKHVIVFLEFKLPSELDSKKKVEKAVKQEIHVARDVNAKYMLFQTELLFIGIILTQRTV